MRRVTWRWAVRSACLVFLLAVLPAASAAAAAPRATTITVTDVVGRSVTVTTPVQRVLLGEARQMYVIAALEPGDPFQRIVGWPADLRTADLDTYDKYRALYPEVEQIPVFGSPASASFSVEQAIVLKPDVMVLNFDAYQPAVDSGLLDTLQKVGIPTVITDFRQYPLENTVPSTLLLGRILGREDRAQQVIDFYLKQVNEVYARLGRIADPSPLAFLYRAPGLLECCGTFGRSNLGLFVERAGGKNLGSDLLPGWSGTLNPEQVLVSDPEIIVATGSNWTYSTQIGTYISLGYTASADQARAQLQQVVDRPGWSGLRAVQNTRVHAIWHQFYNSPYHFVALQQIAKWMYPAEFTDLDPDAAFREFHRQFLPIAYSGTFWVSL